MIKSTPKAFPIGAKVRIVPTEGTVESVAFVRLKREMQPNGRYEYIEVPVYTVRFADGTRRGCNRFEIEEIEK